MIDISQFKGLAPSISPEKLSDGLAQEAVNCKFDSGRLEPDLGNFATLLSGHGSPSADTESLFPYVGSYIFADNPRTYLRSPNETDVHERLYFIEEGGEPRYYAAGVVGVSYKLGLPRPVVGSTNVEDLGDTADALSEHYRSYIVAWVDDYGHLGPTSDAAVVLPPLFTDAHIKIYRPAIPTGDYSMGANAKWRIFRSNSGNGGNAVYQFVKEVALNIDWVVDATPSGDLQEAATNYQWIAPNPEMKDFVAMSGGYFAGFSGNTVYFSEPYLPHAWPYSTSYTENIVGISVIDSGLLVLTDDKPFLLVGNTPQAMARVELRSDQACVSKNSIVDMGGATMFASTDGLCIAYGTEVKNLTETLLHRDDWWSIFDPANIKALRHEGVYVAHSFSFDPKGGLNALVMGNQSFVGHYRDGLSDKTYLIESDGSTAELKTGAVLPYTYKTRKFEYPVPVNFASFRIELGTGSVAVTGYGDGVEIFSGVVSASGTYKLPAGFKARFYEFKFEGVATIHRVFLKTSNQAGN